MESKLFKIFASLGVPGLALGVFYMLFKKFNWQFPIVPTEWVGPIIVLFMLLVSGIVFYALTIYKPSDKALAGPNGMVQVLGELDLYLKDKSQKLNNDTAKKNENEQKIIVNEARAAVQSAINHTKHYIASKKKGKRDRDIEKKLSDEWVKVGGALSKINDNQAQNLHLLCYEKSSYWSDPEGWDRSYYGGDISLENILENIESIRKEYN